MEELDETKVPLGAPMDHRRKWDLKEFECLAAKRLRDEDEQSKPNKRFKDNRSSSVSPKELTIPQRSLLKPRDHKIDLMESEVGRSRLVPHRSSVHNNPSLGFYCKACDCVVKDSTNFLDHVNGKKHQKNLGMSMKIERSSLEKVKERFAMNKKKLEEKKQQYNLMQAVKDQEIEEMYLKEKRKEQRRERKQKLAMAGQRELEGVGDNQDESVIMETMGFCQFGST